MQCHYFPPTDSVLHLLKLKTSKMMFFFPYLLQTLQYWQQQKLRPRKQRKTLSIPPYRLQSAEGSTWKPFSVVITVAVGFMAWHRTNAKTCSQRAFTLAALTHWSCSCSEAALIYFKLHVEVGFGLSIFYYATFLLCWQGMGIKLYGLCLFIIY